MKFEGRNILLAALAHCSILTAVVLQTGCGRNQSSPTPLSYDQAIRRYQNSPVGESIEPITRALATNWVYVGTENLTPTADGKIVGDKMRLKVSTDNRGGIWACAYTSRAEFDKAFPNGGPFAEMAFSDVFGIVDADNRFAGLHLNSASDSQYPIPRELFARMRPLLKQSGQK